jgi:hypothetical protein
VWCGCARYAAARLVGRLHGMAGCAMMNPRKKMLHALRDLAQQLQQQEQEMKQKKNDEDDRKKREQSEAAAAAAAALAVTAQVEEGVPMSSPIGSAGSSTAGESANAGAGAGATAADQQALRALQAENARLRQKVRTMRALLGVPEADTASGGGGGAAVSVGAAVGSAPA